VPVKGNLRETKRNSEKYWLRYPAKLGLRTLATLFALVAIVLLWLQNYNKLSTFNDYSLAAYANAFLNRGMTPYRDFTTPIQAMGYLLGYACELVFGQSYLALTYGNLLLTGVLFLATVRLASIVATYYEALLIAVAVCAASTLQHGIVWYNTLGILWLVLLMLFSFRAVGCGRLRHGDLVILGVLLCCDGMTKLNYAAAGFAIAVFCLAGLYVKEALSARRLFGSIAALTLSAMCLPVLIELAITGATARQWVHNVLIMPAGRAQNLSLFRHSAFWLGTVYPYLRGDPFRGIFALSWLGFAFLSLTLLVRPGVEPVGAKQRIAPFLPFAAAWMFFALSAVIAVTNVELPSVAEALLPIGLLGVCLGFSGELTSVARGALRASASLLAAWLLVLSCLGIARHTRLMYGDGDDWDAPIFPYNVSSGYLAGVRLTKTSAEKLTDAAMLLSKYGIRPGSDEVYWGPGIELLCRQFDTEPLRGFPLFYNPITAPEADAGQIIRRLESSHVRLFIASRFWEQIYSPPSLKKFLTTRWEPGAIGSLDYYIRVEK
jgi:hypothetical protein